MNVAATVQNVRARTCAATAVEACSPARDGLTGLVGVAEARPAAEARS